MVKGEEFSIELHDADIIYPMMNFVPGGKRIMYWIGDFQEIYLPHFFSEDQLKARHVKNRSIVEGDQMLVLSSKAALDDLRENFKTVNAPIRIWRFCSLLPAQPAGEGDLSSLDLPGKFAYLPNQFWVHKNHAIVFRALAQLKERGVVVPLVCTGSPQDKRAPGYFSSLTEIIREAGMSEQIRILGIVPKAQQIEIIRRAAFIVQPSLFEGWSTVVEDAKSLGRPIVLSDLAVHREQDPPNALFFDPNDVDDVAGKLQEAWTRFAPGPDLEAEKQAAARLVERRRQSAREFMNILVEAVTMSADSATRIRG
jgi:glycosyltransferase involved in cell wall biosynthesis